MTKICKPDGSDDLPREKKLDEAYSCSLLNEFILAIVRELVSQKTCRYFLPCADRLTETVDNLLKDQQKDEPPPLIGREEVDTDKASRIVLILESPHVKEYNKVRYGSDGYIVGEAEPARGYTGINIFKYFVPVLKRLQCNDYFNDWRIGLINPIPYSCSFGGHLSKHTKNVIFRKLINECSFVEHFRKRLVRMCNERSILFNCCTYGNNKIIDRLLDSFGYKNYICMCHPSSSKFKKQCCENGEEIEVFNGTGISSKQNLGAALRVFADIVVKRKV